MASSSYGAFHQPVTLKNSEGLICRESKYPGMQEKCAQTFFDTAFMKHHSDENISPLPVKHHLVAKSLIINFLSFF